MSHTVYNASGTEILINTRTVGLLLASTKSHETRSLCGEDLPSPSNLDPGNHGNGSRSHGDHDNRPEQFLVCEDRASPLMGSSGPTGRLGHVLTMWLNSGSREEEEEVEGRSGGILARYTGHRNTRTVLKEAAFWGDHFILSGSDCGRLFVWDKYSGTVLTALSPSPAGPQTTPPPPQGLPPQATPPGRGHIPLSVQPHPSYPVVATCGLESAVRVWEPRIRTENNPEDNLESILSENRRMLREEEYIIPIPNSVVMRALSGMDPGDMLNGIL